MDFRDRDGAPLAQKNGARRLTDGAARHSAERAAGRLIEEAAELPFLVSSAISKK